MIQVLLIEDEEPARKKLKRFMAELQLPVFVVAELESVEQALTFFEAKPHPPIDLIFSDIELRDGHAFDIYKNISLQCPIIFITAYSDYWMNAFETNGIEYLLKPFSIDRFKKAWDKFDRLRGNKPDEQLLLQKIQTLLQPQSSAYKKRLSVNTPKGNYFLNMDNIMYFLAESGIVFAIDTQDKKHLLSIDSLRTLEDQLDPQQFFRISRNTIVNKTSVKQVERYTKNSVAIRLHNKTDQVLIVSQSQTPSFRAWMEA